MSAGSDSIPTGCGTHTGRSRRSARRSRATAGRYAAGLGFTQEKIAALLGITKPTLEKHFREELDRGMALIDYQVGSSLVDQALKGNVNAQTFYLSRRVGWKETTVVENKDSRLESMSDDEIVKELADRANRLGVKIDVSIGERHPNRVAIRSPRRRGRTPQRDGGLSAAPRVRFAPYLSNATEDYPTAPTRSGTCPRLRVPW